MRQGQQLNIDAQMLLESSHVLFINVKQQASNKIFTPVECFWKNKFKKSLTSESNMLKWDIAG